MEIKSGNKWLYIFSMYNFLSFKCEYTQGTNTIVMIINLSITHKATLCPFIISLCLSQETISRIPRNILIYLFFHIDLFVFYRFYTIGIIKYSILYSIFGLYSFIQDNYLESTMLCVWKVHSLYCWIVLGWMNPPQFGLFCKLKFW